MHLRQLVPRHLHDEAGRAALAAFRGVTPQMVEALAKRVDDGPLGEIDRNAKSPL